MPKRILTVGCQIPGGHGRYANINSQDSLLDADIVLFYPTIRGFYRANPDLYQGKPSLSEDSSFQLQKAINHWRRELFDYVKAGRTVFLILPDLDEVYVDTGERTYSGTGRNRQTTTLVRGVSNYGLLPLPMEFVQSKGNSMKLVTQNTLLKDYWQEFGEQSQYRVYIEKTESVEPLVVTPDGSRVVGGLFQGKDGGAVFALPWVDINNGAFRVETPQGKSAWTRAAKEWGTKLVQILTSLDSAIRSQGQVTPKPQWAMDDIYATKKETELSRELLGVQGEITELEKRREDLESQMGDEGWLKALLFEQGKPLEEAVLQAMRLMGFEANNYRDSTSEIDAVLECAEGRCIGEVEGRDNKPIDINKMRQLIVNIQEDFAREEVLELAKGVLFGNAYRLTPPSERPAEHFTAKCMTSAQSSGIALVRTCDLFEVTRELIDYPDESYAADCRQAILDASGQEVQFPSRQA